MVHDDDRYGRERYGRDRYDDDGDEGCGCTRCEKKHAAMLACIVALLVVIAAMLARGIRLL